MKTEEDFSQQAPPDGAPGIVGPTKLSILDIKARDQSDRHFNVEMQLLVFPHYQKRILYYACRLHQQQQTARQCRLADAVRVHVHRPAGCAPGARGSGRGVSWESSLATSFLRSRLRRAS